MLLHDTKLWRAFISGETGCHLTKILENTRACNTRRNVSYGQGFSETKLSTYQQKFKARQLNQ